MNTGSRDEQIMLANIDRIARASEEQVQVLERIARALESAVFGATVEDVRTTTRKLLADLQADAERSPSDER